jgi:chromosome segregation ATPase
MTRLVPFLGRKRALAAEEKPAPPQPAAAATRDDIELDNDLFFPLANQIGQENEGIRNLLIEAEHKVGELEDIKRMIGKLIDPVSKALRAYEEVKSEKLSLQTALTTIRAAHNKLREHMADAEKRAAALDTECNRLRDMAAVAQQSATALERTRTEQAAEIHARRAQVLELQHHVQKQGSELQLTRDENRRLGERLAAIDKRMVQLEAETRTAQQKAMQADNERVALQAALDKALNDCSQTARKLTETEKELAATRAKLNAAEVALAGALAERTDLSAALDDVNHKRRHEASEHHARFDALKARADLNEGLLEEARQALIARAEEVRALERSAAESSDAQGMSRERLAQMAALLEEYERRAKESEQSRVQLTEQNQTLAGALASREADYDRAKQKIKEQEELLARLEHKYTSTREASELQIEQLSAQLQREKIERAMAEGALESGRKDIARLMHELAAMSHRPTSVPAIPGPATKAAATPEKPGPLKSAA